MICPHCQIGTSPNFRQAALGAERRGERRLEVESGNCTECGGLIVLATWLDLSAHTARRLSVGTLYPQRIPPRPVPTEVTGEYAKDFREACLVLQDSPKASAAVSRRLLQHILREKGGFKDRDLNKEIQLAIDSNTLAGDLADDLDMIRTVGNFAAHPTKIQHTGEVVDVEPGEAEALLDLLEELLDHYFVRPAARAKKRAALNQKLSGAGKPPLKGPPPAPPATT